MNFLPILLLFLPTPALASGSPVVLYLVVVELVIWILALITALYRWRASGGGFSRLAWLFGGLAVLILIGQIPNYMAYAGVLVPASLCVLAFSIFMALRAQPSGQTEY